MKHQSPRRYIRINTVLPVQFSLVDEFNKRSTPYLQGFTNDIGKGGICITVNDLWWALADKFVPGKKVVMDVTLPLRKRPITTSGTISWKSETKTPSYAQFRLGIVFDHARKKESFRLFDFALAKKITPLFFGGLLALLVALVITTFTAQKLLMENNRRLLTEHRLALAQSANLKESVERERNLSEKAKQEQKQLTMKISSLEAELKNTQETYADVLTVGMDSGGEYMRLQKRIAELENEIANFKRQNQIVSKALQDHQNSESVLSHIERDSTQHAFGIEKQVINGIYAWIRTRQNLSTGLVLSYEGDKDLEKVAFTYDQALAAITFCVYDDTARAKKILDFYLDQIQEKKALCNAYYTNGGVYEYRVHSGVNAWIGIAALTYVKKTNDFEYLVLAKPIADLLISLMDAEGGITGGPGVDWYSTEHNLDCYAFFKLFYEVTNNTEYQKISEKIKQWLDRYSYTDKTIPVTRGKGDATIATDTYAWSITALNPQELFNLGMDPEEIMQFAVNNCEVQVLFTMGENQIAVRGFDFAKLRNVARGGVVSCEWSAQMILAFEVMADYYQKKNTARYEAYLEKAKFYFSELQKMIINSPSFAGKAYPTLPYASHADVDTGHNWRTPKGDRVGSLASSAYFLLAYKGYNPLTAEFLTVSLENE